MIQQQLKSLDDDINEACEDEDFELADRLQQQINQLKSKLGRFQVSRDKLKHASETTHEEQLDSHL